MISNSQRQTLNVQNGCKKQDQNKLKGAGRKSCNGYNVLSNEEEAMFGEHVELLTKLGLKVTEFDLRINVKNYLDNKGRKVTQFRHNMPGYEWGKLFVKRHPDLPILEKCTSDKDSESGEPSEIILSSDSETDDEIMEILPENSSLTPSNCSDSSTLSAESRYSSDDPDDPPIQKSRKGPKEVITSDLAISVPPTSTSENNSSSRHGRTNLDVIQNVTTQLPKQLPPTPAAKNFTFIDVNQSNVQRAQDSNKSTWKKKFPKNVMKWQSNLQIGHYVLVYDSGIVVPGMIIKLPEANEIGPTINRMTNRFKCWQWPSPKITKTYSWSDVKRKIPPPKYIPVKSCYYVHPLDDWD